MKTQWHYNPFRRLQEQARNPASRFLRTTLWQKCLDVFVVFFGQQKEAFEIDTVGLVDYLSFGGLLTLHQSFLKAYKNDNKSLPSFVFFILSTLINLAAWGVKTVACLVLSLLCFPITLVCHGLSLLFGGHQLYESALGLKGEDKSNTGRANEVLSLSNFLKLHDQSLEKLSAELEISLPPLTSQLLGKTRNVGNQLVTLLSWRSEPIKELTQRAQSKITLFYTHTENKPWFSNSSFVYLSVLFASLFPCIAIFSAKSMTQSATKRLTAALTGEAKDVFEVIVDPNDVEQQLQLSALFQLNVSNILNELYCLDNVNEEENTLLEAERQRLILL